jgi:hypothetical protein
LVGALWGAGVGTAGPIVLETEPNNPFGSRQQVGGAGGVAGGVTSGNADFFQFSRPAGSRVAIAITAGTFDTVLGQFSSTGAILRTDDDSGVGLLSAFGATTVDATGQLYLGATAYADFGFTGAHSSTGSYTLEVINQLAQIDGTLSAGTTRTFTFFGDPGTAFVAEVTAGDFDSVLGLRNSAGVILGTDDDSGAGLLSLIFGTVPADGRFDIVVTGFPDFGLTGAHGASGTFRLEVFATSTPEPSSVVLFGVLAATGALATRRRAKAAAA